MDITLGLAKRVMRLPYDLHLASVDAEIRLRVQRLPSRLEMERLRWNGHMLRGDDKMLFGQQHLFHLLEHAGEADQGAPIWILSR